MSLGTPSSVMLSRWTSPVSRTNTHPGANARAPANHSRRAPDTYRALASLPRISASTSRSAIASSTRARRSPITPTPAFWARNWLSEPPFSRPKRGGSCRVGRVGVVGQELVAGVGDGDDLLAAVAAGAVRPRDRLDHEHHPRREHDALVEVGAEVGADERRLRAVDADPVGEIEVREPRPAPVARGRERSTREVAAGRAGRGHSEDGVDDLLPPAELV